MHSHISNTSKTSQNSSLTTAASILQPRDFGMDTPQPETVTEKRDLDAEYEYAKKMSRYRTEIPTFPPDLPPNIQPKLSIGQPNDKYEQEADNVATKVVNEINRPSFIENPINAYPLVQTYPYTNTPKEYNRPILQRVKNPALLPQENLHHVGLHPEVIENYLRRKEAEQQSKISTNNQELENTIQSKKGSGQEIAADVRKPMEQAFGADFSSVRVHTDGESDQLNQSLNAKAFATGKDIFFRQGAYSPTSRDGQHLLAHELTHIVQQNGNTVQPKSRTKIARKENKIASKIAENPQQQQEEDNELQAEKSTSQTSSSLEDNTEKTSQTVTAKSNKVSSENIATAKESNETVENADTPESNPASSENVPNTKESNEVESTDTPTDEQEQASSTTKSSKQLAAAGATDTTDNTSNSPTTSINESGSTAIASNGAKAPDSAQQDPEFQAVVSKSKIVARQHKQHDPARSKSQQAQVAAQPPSNEVESKAQSNHVGEMGEAETPAFDAAAFKAKLMERIADMAPKNLKEADEFKNNNKIDSMKGELSGQVKEEQKKSQGTLEEKTQEPPNTNGIEAKQVTPLPPAESGTVPTNIGADKAAPKPKTQSEVEVPLQQDSEKIDQQMADAKVTDEQLANSNEPEFQSALANKKQAETSAVQAGPQYRQQEQNLITTAKTTAESTAQQHLQQMQTVKTQNITQVSSEQVGTKGKDEEARTKIAGDINKIYETTKTKVEQTLSGLDSKVQQAFDTGAANAKKAFEDYVGKRMDDYKKHRYGGMWGWTKWIKDQFVGMPSEVNAFYQEGRQLYINQMNSVINHVVGIVSEGLTQAKAEIANGKQEIQQYVQKLPQELQAIGEEATTDIQGKFDELQQSIDDKQGELIDSLAQKYQENLQAVDARIEEMKAANKGLLDKALDAVVGVIKTIIELTKMLIQVLARAAAAVGDIIKNPIQFLGNLIAAVKQGFLNFVKNIGKHLQTGLIAWLTGTMAGAGITIPENFDLKGVFSLVTQILGLTYDFIRSQAVNRLGEEKVSYLEKGEETFKILATEGLPGIWHLLQDKVGDIKTMVMDGITDFVTNTIVQAGIEFVLSMLTPASAFVKACKMIIDIVKFFIERAQQIADLINAIIDSVTAIASGAIGQATQAIENALAKSLPVALGFLASLLGLGGITQKIQAIIQKVRQPVVKAVNWVIDKGAKVANKIGGKFKNSKVGKKVVKAKKAAEKKYQAGKKYIEDKKAAGQKYFDEKKQAVHQSIEKQKNKFANTKTGKALTRVNDAANKKLDALEKKRQAFNNKIEKVKEWPGKQLEKVENKAAEWRGKAKDKLTNSKLGKNVSQKWDKAKDWGSKKKDAFKDKVDKLEGKVQDKFGIGKDKEKYKTSKEAQKDKQNTNKNKNSANDKKTVDIPFTMKDKQHTLFLTLGAKPSLEMASKRDHLSNKIGRAIAKLQAQPSKTEEQIKQIEALKEIGVTGKLIQKYQLKEQTPELQNKIEEQSKKLTITLSEYGKNYNVNDLEEIFEEIKFIKQRAKLKSKGAIEVFDTKYQKILGYPPKTEKFDAFGSYLDATAKKKNGDLEQGLLEEYEKANKPPKAPYGEQVDQLPRLRKEAESLKGDIENWLNTEHGQRITGAKRLIKTIDNDLKGVMSKMETGKLEATVERIQGFENNLKGVRSEFENAKSAPSDTEIGGYIKFADKKIEIDQIRPDGTWINVKNYELFGLNNPKINELITQAEMNLRAAEANLVRGTPPAIVFDFPKGVTPEVAQRLRKIELNGRHLQVTGPEISLPESQ